jgi:hypothetical protein
MPDRLTSTTPQDSPTGDALKQGLRELGYVEGRNIIIEWRSSSGFPERFPELAADVMRLALKRPSASPPEGLLTEVLPTRFACGAFVSPGPRRKPSAHCRRPLIDHMGQKADDVVVEK